MSLLQHCSWSSTIQAGWNEHDVLVAGCGGPGLVLACRVKELPCSTGGQSRCLLFSVNVESKSDHTPGP